MLLLLTSLLSSTLEMRPYLLTRSLRMGRCPLAAAYHTALFPFYINTTYIYTVCQDKNIMICVCVFEWGLGYTDVQNNT